MLETKFLPRFNDTDALGHINNASYSTWFEEARRPIFQFFVPDLDPKKWSLILARVEIDFLTQGNYQKETTVTTKIEKIGNTSFTLLQEAFQGETIVCRGKSVLVHFNYATNKSTPIPESIKTNLQSISLFSVK